MSAETTTVSVDEIDAALAAATPDLGEDEQRLATAVLQLLSAGEPAAVPAAAALAGMPVSRAERALRAWPGVFWDGHGDRKSTRLNSSHVEISYAVFCL